ncbi:hypothetical protein, partial [Thermocrinis sp.]
EKESLLKTLNEKEKEVDYLSGVLVAKENQLQELMSQLETLQTEKEDLSQALNERERLITSLGEDIQNLASELETLKSEKESLLKTLNEKEKEVDYLSGVLVAKENQLQELMSQLETLQTEKESLSNTLAEREKVIEEKDFLIERLSREKGELIVALMELKKTWQWKYLVRPLIKIQKFFQGFVRKLK